MISNTRLKLIRSLARKKVRDQHGLFMVEGEKMVRELAECAPDSRFTLEEVFATPEWIEENKGISITAASQQEINKASQLVTPPPVFAVVHIPEDSFRPEQLLHTPVLAFESIRDPGNLGTIIRTADWFGIGHIVCSPDSTDLYNPKVVQSTMGAITRVQVHYVDLESWLAGKEMQGRPVYGTFLDGENIYESVLESNPVILFGNESRGLSGNIGKRVTKRLSIPSFSPQGEGSESLNVASSVAVLCSELKRRS
jgi:TrmH family RNA methyltransferase